MTMLSIKDLHVSVENQKVLNGLNLEIQPGTVHAIMGPNGAGKSTLAAVLAGRPEYVIESGEILYQGKDLRSMSIEARAHAGVFLAFQYPTEIPGVSNISFLRAALNAKRKAQGLPELDALDFLNFVKAKLPLVQMPEEFLYRALNDGFSGGEKKRNEIFQLSVLEPNLAILDETDSGLDIDALQTVSHGVNAMRSPDRSMLVITHYQRLLNYIEPDVVHVLANGRIVQSGDKTLALELEAKGYRWLAEATS